MLPKYRLACFLAITAFFSMTLFLSSGYADNLNQGDKSAPNLAGTTLPENTGLPKNSRQTKEGYWVGSNPNKAEIEALHQRNVKLIVTLTPVFDPTGDLREYMKTLGMTHINIPFGSHFPRPSRFYARMLAFQPAETYIHCEHGSDRTGAFLAYMLAVRHEWSVQRALLSVLLPSEELRLRRLLKKRGYSVEQTDRDSYLGIYSAALNGGYGGLKVRSADYILLIHTTIDAIEKTRRLMKRNAKSK